MRVMHIRRGLPLISAEQEPHLPALQFQRHAMSGASVACRRWMMSRTTSPSLTSTSKSFRSPPEASPRQTLNLPLYPMSLLLGDDVFGGLGGLGGLGGPGLLGQHRQLLGGEGLLQLRRLLQPQADPADRVD